MTDALELLPCPFCGPSAKRKPRLPPLCCRQGSPVTADPPATDHPAPVGLPAALWMLLAGLGALYPFRRKDPKQKLREQIARWANDQPQDWGPD